MPIWFLIFLVICTCFAVGSAIHKIRGGGLYIGGERMNPLTVALAAIGMMIVLGLFAAMQLGFIPNHAP